MVIVIVYYDSNSGGGGGGGDDDINNNNCHNPNLGSMIDNVGAVPIGHHNYAKSQNEYIKRTSYLKNYSISLSFKILYYSKLMKPNDNSKLLINN